MFRHVTVLKEEAVEGLNIRPDGIYVDCTLGGAGHSSYIASQLNSQGLLIAIDQDDVALEHARTILSGSRCRVELVKSNFRHLTEVLLRFPNIPQTDGRPQVNGILFDLGVSSPQLDEAERGFSYNKEAELDMRMDRSVVLTAKEIVNSWSEGELAKIIFEYGEERFAKKIARRIAEAREKQPIESTAQLAEIVKESIPAAARRTGPHPAKRTFQALRIAVNDELGALEEALDQSVQCLAPGGRVSVITFHSLEDRICKLHFAKFVGKCTCPPDFPMCVCRNTGVLKLVNRKPIIPGESELTSNPRARSAKLRIAEKI